MTAAAAIEAQPTRRSAEGYGDMPPPDAPRYVHGCHREENHLLLWPREWVPPLGGGWALRVPARCGSWRHGGECQRARARQDFARIRRAFDPGAQPHPLDGGWTAGGDWTAEDLVFLVLTLDRLGTSGGEPWADRDEAFRALGDRWTRLRARLDYELGRCRCSVAERRERYGTGRRKCPSWSCPHAPATQGIGSRWVLVVEQHRSGWPHCNVLAVCRPLATAARRSYARARAEGRTHRRATLVGDDLDLRRHVVGCGFGSVSSCEAVESIGSLAGYFAGLSDDPLDIDPSAGELAKLLQVPTEAPHGFRRLRSGVGFLPPRWAKRTHTGVLVNAATRSIVSKSRTLADQGVVLDVEYGRVYASGDPALLPVPRTVSRVYQLKVAAGSA